MNDQALLRKNSLIQKLEALDPSKLALDGFFKKVFCLLLEEVDFQAAWYFPVESLSLQRTVCSLQMWDSTSPKIEAERILLDDKLFPSVHHLMDSDTMSIRGNQCWTGSQLMRHPIYWKLLRPNNLFYSFISLLLNNRKRCIGYLVLWRTKDKAPFDHWDTSLLSDLSPRIGDLLQNISQGSKTPEKKKESKKSGARLLNPIKQVSGIDEDELYSMIRRRTQPGVLILSREGEIRYSNHDARNFLKKLVAKPHTSEAVSPGRSSKNTNIEGAETNDQKDKSDFILTLPEIVYELYDHFVKATTHQENSPGDEKPTVNRICVHSGIVYLLRALQLHQHKGSEKNSEIMILIERVSQGFRFDQIGETTKLTPREGEVVQLLLEGKTNKELAVCIEIGEYTVKDHIKRIMKKLEVTTRAGIVAKVLQSHFPS